MTAKLDQLYRKCGSSVALDTHWKSAMEPISLVNNQQKQENKWVNPPSPTSLKAQTNFIVRGKYNTYMNAACVHGSKWSAIADLLSKKPY